MKEKSSINSTELHKFDKPLAEWWDESGSFKTLHAINPLRLQYITEKISEKFSLNLINRSNDKPLLNLKIIDVGCGGGLISVPLSKLGANMTALDPNNHNIELASKFIKNHDTHINFINNTIEEHVNSKEKYDVIICLEVIEHVDHQEEFVLNLTKLLKPNGIIILSTVNRTAKSYLQTIIFAEYILRWLPIKTHDHAKYVKPSELGGMLNNTDLQIRELKGLKLNPLSNSWFLSDNIDVNYFAVID